MEPIKFKPILKQTIWGGCKIADFKQIGGHSGEQIGESWEISGVEGCESVALNGPYKGKKLTEIVAAMKEKLMGTDNYKRFGDSFPLLIKFIDASQDLSIQVHPNDEIARKRGLKNGKTEMWFIMDSDPQAYLRCGLNSKITPEQYKEMVENHTICDAIAEFPVKADDCFFIPSGMIHSIGKGCFLVEIQQTSDVTYRIYDFNRRDKDGNLRELHTEEAAECIDYNVQKDYRTNYVPEKNAGIALAQCEYFNTAVYDLDEPMTLDYSELDSFVAVIAIKGEATFTDNEGNTTTLRGGETMLVPATTETLHVNGNIKFLETYA